MSVFGDENPFCGLLPWFALFGWLLSKYIDFCGQCSMEIPANHWVFFRFHQTNRTIDVGSLFPSANSLLL